MKSNQRKNKKKPYACNSDLEKNVFQQKSETSTYAFSKVVDGKRVMLSVEELKQNVLKLINLAHNVPSPDKSDSHLLVGKIIEHRYLDKDSTTST